MAEASLLCDHIALLNQGKIIEYGHPDDICRKYDQKKSIMLQMKESEVEELPMEPESCERMKKLMKEKNVISIHTSEPNLESVFIALTGRKLV